MLIIMIILIVISTTHIKVKSIYTYNNSIKFNLFNEMLT
jgi:hypothetical protein